MDKKHTVFITGAAGYVGVMLVQTFLERPDVEKVIGLDKDAWPDELKGLKNLVWIDANTSETSWQKKVAEHQPDIVIHPAWQIREMYGKKQTQWKWNAEGSENVFTFALNQPTVKRLIHFSTASIYGAYPDNTIEHRYTEDEPMRDEIYLYAIEKRFVDERLMLMLKEAKEHNHPVPSVYVVRPAAISGPRGRAMEKRFGLQSALSGTLKGSFVYDIVRVLVAFVPATKGWCRQFIHEDDIVNILTILSFDQVASQFEIFNLTPPGPAVLPKDMARAVGKRVLMLPPQLIRIAFFFFWHITAGRIPTARGSWRFYSYPVVMDGTKVTKMLGYTYTYESQDAFTTTEGRYGVKGGQNI